MQRNIASNVPLSTFVRPNGDDKPINTLTGDGDRRYRKSASQDDSWVDNNGREKKNVSFY